jgi:lysophospholipase L1-like esterase
MSDFFRNFKSSPREHARAAKVHRFPSFTKLLIRTLCALLVLTTLALAFLPWVLSVLAFGQSVPVSDLRPESGLAYLGRLSNPKLSDHEGLSPAMLFLIETRRGGIIHRLGDVFGDSYFIAYLKALYEVRFPTHTYEVRIPLGPAHSLHADIRQYGDGRYSIWHGEVYFSLPAGKTLGTVRGLEVIDPYFTSLSQPETVRRILQSTAFVAVLGVFLYGLGLLLRRSVLRWAGLRNIIPGIAISIVLLVAIGGIGELYFRLNGMVPKNRMIWSNRYVEGLGFLFQPNGEVQITNGLDFWVTQRANSLGFLDWEPVLPKPAETFRILLIGDSMVEAAQVTRENKLQTYLAQLLRNKLPGRKFDIVAMGYSGMGESNEIRYFEEFSARLEPDLVVLLFTTNDFANHSPLLEAVRQGWHPGYLPWLFFRKNSDGSCSRIPISSEWPTHRIPGGSEGERLRQLREMSPDYRRQLDGWVAEGNDAAQLDIVFFDRGPLPPVFEEAVELTKCSFAEWKRLTADQGLPLIVMAHETVTDYGIGVAQQKFGQIDRLREILSELKIPLLDLYPVLVKRADLKNLRWRFDGHWTPLGHQLGAEALFEFLRNGGYLAARKNAESSANGSGSR